MEGEIGVDSVPGQGSVFWFTARFQVQEGSQETGLPDANFRFALAGLPEATSHVLEAQLKEWGYAARIIPPDAGGLLQLRDGGAAQCHDDRALLIFGAEGGISPGMLDFLQKVHQEPALEGLRLIMAHSLYEQEEARKPTALSIAEFLPLPMRKAHLKALLDRSRDAFPLPAVAEAAPITEGALSTARLLVTEDNAVNQRVAIAILRKLGFCADVAANGLEAVELLRTREYDLVFMDCQMPEMDGFQATRAIREMERGARRVPILAMTANAMQGDRERCLEAGMDDYISKPITIVDLKGALHRWLPPV
jgi:CheY-like chemotaxis protein